MTTTRTSILTGMTLGQLTSALSGAQAAYTELMTGKRGVTFSYTQGDGSKTVTYDKVDQAQLMAFIRMLQAEIAALSGTTVARRRPMRPFW